VLGQQISVAAARTLAQRLLLRVGKTIPSFNNSNVQLFPTPEALADADLAGMGITRARADTLRTIARAVRDGIVDFRPEQSLQQFVDSWTALPGIGAWTAHYIAMRALSNPDAFPAADLVLRRAVSSDGVPVTTKALADMAKAWRPWRAYAVLHLWRSQS
jgi:AraC family transcriptional regulator of adaptative response / DNA-3-methyladenine glycosylase II